MHLSRNVLARAIGLISLIALGFAPALAHAEHIKIGILKTPPSGLVFIALDKGYFAAEGLDVELSYFEAGQPIALATAAGSIDFGANGPSAAFYNLAGEGVLRIIAGMYREAPSFRILGYPGLAILLFLAAAIGGLGLVFTILVNDIRAKHKPKPKT